VSGKTFRHQVDIAATPETVFPFLTQAELMTVWMGDHATLNPVPGGEFTVDINGVPVRGRFLRVEPPHRLVVTWGHAGSAALPPGSTTVEITLTPTDTGTRLTLVHRDLPANRELEHATGWPHFISRLQVAGAGGDPGPDPYAQASNAG
jgi:uncharacterized protein YndB with AHSA1/START domain